MYFIIFGEEKNHNHPNARMKSTGQNPIPIHHKHSQKVGIEGNLKKDSYKKLTATITSNGQRLNAIPVKSGTMLLQNICWKIQL